MPAGAYIPIITLAAVHDACGRPFTAVDDIGIAQFEYYSGGIVPSGGSVIKYSPDGRYFVVITERGVLDRNVPEDTIWLFHTEEVRKYVQHPDSGIASGPIPLARLTTTESGPIIENVRWLADSSGIVFTAPKENERCKFAQLYLVDIKSGALESLTPDEENVSDFDIRSRSRYIYVVSAPRLLKTPPPSDKAVVLTGKNAFEALFPHPGDLKPFKEGGLWVAIDGNRSRVLDAKTYGSGNGLALSPDGNSAAALMTTQHSPSEWSRYKVAPGAEAWPPIPEFRAYYLIDLQKHAKRLLFNAPSGSSLRWNSAADGDPKPTWSADGRSLLLPNTFLPLDSSDSNEAVNREHQPYIAVLRLDTSKLSPILPLKRWIREKDGHRVKGHYFIDNLRFVDDRTVVINYDRAFTLPGDPQSGVFHQENEGTWQGMSGGEDPITASLAIKIETREGINQPPQIVAADKEGGDFHIIWDPNPQLKEIELGAAEVIHGRDSTGFEWEAGLVKPLNYEQGRRYPLVIQTHGFWKNQFLTNGIFSTAFAARAFAAQGIMVVQAPDNSYDTDTPQEGPDHVALYKSIVNALVDQDLVDPGKIGAIGFSRTVYRVLYAITVGNLQLAAASVTDGVSFGYFQEVAAPEFISPDSDPINGGSPFDDIGMKNWRMRSPEFNLRDVKTALLSVQPGPRVVLGSWAEYSIMHALHKPVDLVMLPSGGGHVFTKPSQRLLSETLNVDWFRFWLQGREDPDPAKAGQYVRWRELRRLQQGFRPAGASEIVH